MKKILFIACLSVVSLSLKAQGVHVNWGVKAGLNLATLNIEDDTTDYSLKPSFNAGLLAHIHFSEDFALQPELIYSGQGTKYSLAGDDYNLNLSYINLPVLLQYMFGGGFRVETGPQVGALISANSKVGSNSEDIKDNFNTMDFSWVFGLGYVSASGFGGDVRYNLGISNINKTDPPKTRNSVIAVGLFYQFGGAED